MGSHGWHPHPLGPGHGFPVVPGVEQWRNPILELVPGQLFSGFVSVLALFEKGFECSLPSAVPVPLAGPPRCLLHQPGQEQQVAMTQTMSRPMGITLPSLLQLGACSLSSALP